MTDQNSNNENKQRRFDPELLKKGLRCDLDQYDMLKRCSDKKDMTEWNDWRKHIFGKDIHLEGAYLSRAYLEGADFYGGHLEEANLSEAHLANAELRHAHLEGANLEMAILNGLILVALISRVHELVVVI